MHLPFRLPSTTFVATGPTGAVAPFLTVSIHA